MSLSYFENGSDSGSDPNVVKVSSLVPWTVRRISPDTLKRMVRGGGSVNPCGGFAATIPGMSDHLKNFKPDSLNMAPKEKVSLRDII